MFPSKPDERGPDTRTKLSGNCRGSRPHRPAYAIRALDVAHLVAEPRQILGEPRIHPVSATAPLATSADVWQKRNPSQSYRGSVTRDNASANGWPVQHCAGPFGQRKTLMRDKP